MFWATDPLTKKQAFWHHLVAGLFYNTFMYYWLYKVMNVGSPWVILPGLGILIFTFSLINGYLGVLYLSTKQRKWHKLLYPTLWVGVEVARTKGQMSFPWGHVGYGFGEYLPWVQPAAWIGVFGLSWLVLWHNGMLYSLIPLIQQGFQKRQTVWPKFALGLVLPIALYVIGALIVWKAPTHAEKSARISLVQPSIDQSQKWDEVYFEGVVQKTLNLMHTHSIDSGSLVILPETAIPDFLKDRWDIQKKFIDWAHTKGVDIVLGSLDYKQYFHPGRPYTFYNSAFLFSADPQKNVLQYSKQYLVPFSERLPFDNIFPVINYVNLGEGDFALGDGNKVWGSAYKYSPSICYEVVYPQFVRSVKREGVDLLLNITNDGWFGNSAAPYQHASMNRFRAVESGVSIARSANTGISIFYDVYGRDLGHTSLMEETVLTRTVPLYSRDTLYQSWGDIIEWAFFWLWALYAIYQFVMWVRSKIKKA
jgi:apolipoprotein N-acyltransferase